MTHNLSYKNTTCQFNQKYRHSYQIIVLEDREQGNEKENDKDIIDRNHYDHRTHMMWEEWSVRLKETSGKYGCGK